VAWRQDAPCTTVRWFLELLDELAAGAGQRLAQVAGGGLAT